MGPRQGSPAAETLRETLSFIGICLILLGGFAKPCGAGTAEVSHSVTVVVVEPTLSLKDDTGHFSLAFKEGSAGASSTTQLVHYQIHGNTLSPPPSTEWFQRSSPTRSRELRSGPT